MPKVSFCIPNWNKGCFLAQAIDSVRKQTLADWELIVVDDNSSDGTQDLLKHYHRIDKRIKPILRRKRYGADAARNLAAKAASSDLLLVLDADDWSDKNRARITYDFFKKYPDTDLFYGSFMTAEPNGRTVMLVTATPIDRFILEKTGFFEICHSTVAYPKRIWKKYPYDGGGEWNLYWNIYKNGGTIRCTKRMLGAYRCSESVEADYSKFKHLLEKKRKKMGLRE